MKKIRLCSLLALMITTSLATAEGKQTPMAASFMMAQSTWPQIEKAFQEDWLVLIPLAAGCKEHGYHLPMNTDLILAERLARYVSITHRRILIAPPITDSFFPAFVEYPGSASLTLDTATNVIVERCKLWYQQGARRFYILNTGISTNQPLSMAKQILEKDCPGIVFNYLDLTELDNDPRIKHMLQQTVGTHADELETSMMLYLEPSVVHLEKAKPEEVAKKPGPLTRDIHSMDKTISVSGAWGNPTYATREKGKIAVIVLEEIINKQLQAMGETKLSASPQIKQNIEK